MPSHPLLLRHGTREDTAVHLHASRRPHSAKECTTRSNGEHSVSNTHNALLVECTYLSSQVSYRITYLLLSAPTCLVECPTMLHTSWSVHKLWCVQVSLGSPLEGVLPSLVVCPPTLTGHWCYEVDKFCPSEHLRVLHYAGNIGERLL